MKNPRLLCLGDLMLDVVARASVALEQGTDVPGTVRFRAGGSAGNTSRAFAALGGSAALVCAIGDDGVARRLMAAIRAEGVRVHGVAVRGLTPRLVAFVAPNGERSFVTDRGVADSLSARALKPAWFARVDFLHVPAYSLLRAPTSEAALRAASLVRAGGGLVSVDLASRAPLLATGVDHGRRAVRAMEPDVLFANADEVAALVGRGGAPRLLDLAPIVVVKQGSAGCSVLWRGPTSAPRMEIQVATRAVAATDTTGAGDAFDAGFLHSLIAGGYRGGVPSAAVMRRASLAGHRAAARLLTSRRPELIL